MKLAWLFERQVVNLPDYAMLMNSPTALDQQIRADPRPFCTLCGTRGEFIHVDLPDRLFGAPGHWSLKRCLNRRCQLIWLDPMPVPEDLGKAYSTYYTHKAPEITESSPRSLVRRCYRLLKMSYLADKYGYETGVNSVLARSLGKLLYVFPTRRRDVDGFVRHLRWVPQGKLLDVGCGAGHWMLLMRELGWNVQGVDFDEASVSLARAQGLKIHQGSLEEQNLGGDHFDAVMLNHVIEHVVDPVRTLIECARILKPGGRLIMATPNSSALAHRIFKQYWRGLEPPRHLHLFNPVSMRKLLDQIGFKKASLRVENSLFIWKETFKLWGQTRRDVVAKFAEAFGPYLFVILERCWLTVHSSAGEALSVEAVKE